MPESPAGKRIHKILHKEYGKKEGDHVFYGMEAEGKIPGMKPAKAEAKKPPEKKK